VIHVDAPSANAVVKLSMVCATNAVSTLTTAIVEIVTEGKCKRPESVMYTRYIRLRSEKYYVVH
jgi:hypothetical protein